MILRTERLLFRAHETGDEAAFIAMHSDPDVRKYVGGAAWPVEKAATRFREQYLGKPEKTYGLWATVLVADGSYVGMCGLSGSSTDARLAYYIAKPHWGRGLATEAARAFVDFGFRTLELPRIRADADRGNVASERILRRLRFDHIDDEALPTGRVISHYALVQGH